MPYAINILKQKIQVQIHKVNLSLAMCVLTN